MVADKPTIKIKENENAFLIIGKTCIELRKNGQQCLAGEYQKIAWKQETYDNLLYLTSKYVAIELI